MSAFVITRNDTRLERLRSSFPLAFLMSLADEKPTPGHRDVHGQPGFIFIVVWAAQRGAEASRRNPGVAERDPAEGPPGHRDVHEQPGFVVVVVAKIQSFLVGAAGCLLASDSNIPRNLPNPLN